MASKSRLSEWRIELATKKDFEDVLGNNLLVSFSRDLGIKLKNVRVIKLFRIISKIPEAKVRDIAFEMLVDPVVNDVSINRPLSEKDEIVVEREFLPGVTDNEAKTAREQIELFLKKRLREGESVHTGIQYVLKGCTLEEAEKISKWVANPLIHKINVREGSSKPISGMEKDISSFKPKVETINLWESLRGNVRDAQKINRLSHWELLQLDDNKLEKFGLQKVSATDDDLARISSERVLALTVDELKTFRNYFKDKKVVKQRKKFRLELPTDVELEAFAQTNSEHCKHKIFNALIDYRENEKSAKIDSIFRTYIKSSTEKLAKIRKELVSVFKDNAGIIRFDKNHYVCFKVETHNSPSALDPFGGSETGIVGVNRDILGAGLGAKPIANTDIFCLVNPFYEKPLPPRVLHPMNIYQGVRAGIESGGNKSGIPTVNGAYCFDDRYMAKPLVYCGTVGIMPSKIKGKDTSVKKAKPNDLIVMIGGRIGKDGIHGATFSSEELHEGSPSAAVQIGDPITQKKMSDLIMEARDLDLYNSITDNGAGGLSSSVGEMALQSNGCIIDLTNAPLKYPGLHPWEILLSESQERMSLAIPKNKIKKFLGLCKLRDVEAIVLGKFTHNGKFHVLFNKKTVAYLDIDFFHNGLPQMKLEAEFISKKSEIPNLEEEKNYSEALKNILADLDVCSKEDTIRRYDHEVRGGSVIKPLVGINNDGPGDAGVIKPLLDSKQGLAISNGICPKFSDFDCYDMTSCAIDEAIRNAVAVGANPEKIFLLDNFCWADPVYHKIKNPDGKHKLAQLVRAARAVHDCSLIYETPFISGKDSMKNDLKYYENNVEKKLSVPLTILISAIGIVDDVKKCVSMDVKKPGDLVYVLGTTYNELGGSNFLKIKNIKEGINPKVRAVEAKKIYEKLHYAISQDLIESCHDCSDGGLAVALAESAFAGMLGMAIKLNKVPNEKLMKNYEVLFSESPSRFIVTIEQKNKKKIERIFSGLAHNEIGIVTDNNALEIFGLKGELVVNENIVNLKDSWKKTLSGYYEKD